MSVAGGFIAIVTNHAFALFKSKLIFTYMTLPKKNFSHNYKNLKCRYMENVQDVTL